MNNEYDDLKEFWNNALKCDELEKIDSKWIEDESFNNTITKYFKNNSNILDYGSGSGWGLIELSYTIKINKGIGIDTSFNGVDYSNKLVKYNNIQNLEYICSNEDILLDYENFFDGAISINLFDVIPDSIIDNILKNISVSLKKDSYLLIGINPEFDKEFLIERGFKYVNNKLYKDNILRGNEHTKEEWINIFNKYFSFVDYFNFSLVEQEKKYPRRMFVLKNNK